jgi:hypothetical protein
MGETCRAQYSRHASQSNFIFQNCQRHAVCGPTPDLAVGRQACRHTRLHLRQRKGESDGETPSVTSPCIQGAASAASAGQPSWWHTVRGTAATARCALRSTTVPADLHDGPPAPCYPRPLCSSNACAIVISTALADRARPPSFHRHRRPPRTAVARATCAALEWPYFRPPPALTAAGAPTQDMQCTGSPGGTLRVS